MSLLDELFDDLKEDLEKAEEEEAAPVAPVTTGTKRPASDAAENSAAAVRKQPKFMPAQLMNKPKKEVVTSAAPTINKEYLQAAFGLQDSSKSNPIDERRKSNNGMPSVIPALRPSTLAPPIAKPALQQDQQQLVFRSTAPPTSSSSSQSTSVSAGDKTTATDYALFVGNLGQEVRDDALQKIFGSYGSMSSVHVVLESSNKEKCKGYGFVYFKDPFEMLKAMREKQGKLCGSRPMLISKAKGGNKQQ